MADFTILSQRAQAVLRCTLPSAGATLQEFSPQGVQHIDLTDTELRAFLRALPPTLLQEVLDEGQPFRSTPLPSLPNGHTPLGQSVLDLRRQSLANAILRLPEGD
jgi:hypothetical protein